MNQLYTFLSLFITCLFSATLIAQPTLTTANNPMPSLNYNYQTSSAVGFNIGGSGANVTWDYSSLTINGTPIEGKAIAASAASSGTAFPNATVAIMENNGTETFLFGDVNAQGFVGASSVSGGQTALISFSDRQHLIEYPMTYTDNFTDAFSGTVGTSGSMLNRGGNITVTADGYGTLMTPAGTFDNVLRLHSVINYTDQIGGQTIVTYQEERYTWYDETAAFPLLTYTTLTANGATSIFLNYLDATAVNTKEVKVKTTDISLAPNPASDFAILNFDLEKNANVQATIFNLIGQEKIVLPIQQYPQGKNEINFNLSQLASGTYFVRMEIDGNIVTRKLIIK